IVEPEEGSEAERGAAQRRHAVALLEAGVVEAVHEDADAQRQEDREEPVVPALDRLDLFLPLPDQEAPRRAPYGVQGHAGDEADDVDAAGLEAVVEAGAVGDPLAHPEADPRGQAPDDRAPRVERRGSPEMPQDRQRLA